MRCALIGERQRILGILRQRLVLLGLVLFLIPFPCLVLKPCLSACCSAATSRSFGAFAVTVTLVLPGATHGSPGSSVAASLPFFFEHLPVGSMFMSGLFLP